MKNLFCFFAILFVLVCGGSNASAQKPLQNIRPVTSAEAENLKSFKTQSLIKPQPTGTNSPIWVISTTGNSTSGITALACNAKAIQPDVIIVGTVTTPDGVQLERQMFYIIQEVEAGTFCYPLDTQHKYDWNERSGFVKYEMWIYQTSSGELISYSSAQKPINRYWSNDVTTTKLIDAGSTQAVNGTTFIKLEGRIVNNGAVSIMLKDGESDNFYPRPVPPQAITRVGQTLRINTSLAEFQTTPYGEIVVIVANHQGISDSYTVRVKP